MEAPHRFNPTYHKSAELSFSPRSMVLRSNASEMPRRINQTRMFATLLLQSNTAGLVHPLTLRLYANAHIDETQLLSLLPDGSSIAKSPMQPDVLLEDLLNGEKVHHVAYAATSLPTFDPRLQSAFFIERHEASKESALQLFFRRCGQWRTARKHMPLVLEDGVGKIKIWDSDEVNRRVARKVMPNEKQPIPNQTRCESGFACGVLSTGTDDGKNLRINFLRFRIADGSPVVDVYKIVASKILATLEHLGVDVEEIESVCVISQFATFAAGLYSLWLGSRPKLAEAIDFPDFTFGWNPVASILEAMTNTKRVSVIVRLERFPELDILVVQS